MSVCPDTIGKQQTIGQQSIGCCMGHEPMHDTWAAHSLHAAYAGFGGKPLPRINPFLDKLL